MNKSKLLLTSFLLAAVANPFFAAKKKVVTEEPKDPNEMVAYLRDTFLARHDGLELLMGVPMMQYFLSSQSPSIDAIPAGDSIFLQRYNAAILVKKESVETYKKIILAPFSERMPFVSVFPFLTKHKVKKPGTFFLNHAIGEQQNVLYANRARIGCFICYESAFGNFCAEFANRGAEVLCVVTNDGWWLKSTMARQHLLLGQIRAIENRRSLVRCTNTGITAGIDQRGRIVAQAPWWEPTALKVTLNKNRTKTLYTQWGDYIGVISVLFSLLVIMLTLYKSIATHRLQGAGRIGKGRKS